MTEPGEPHRRGWRRHAIWVTTVVAVIALVVAGVIIHNVRKDRLDVGALRTGKVTVSVPVVSSSAPFTVPNAQLMVRAAAGQSGTVEDDDSRIRAPRDGVLVSVSWSSIRSQSPVADHVGGGPSSLAVRSEGRTVTIDPEVMATGHEKHAVVALPGNADSVVLEVGFAGRTQSVELRTGRRHAGAFSSLYYNGAWPFGPDPALSVMRKQPADPTSPFTWNAEVKDHKVFRVPYLKGLGWAAAGREWLVVDDVGYYLNDDAARWRSGDRHAQYAVKGTPRLAVTAAGRGPVKVLRKPHESGDRHTYSAPVNGEYVFSTRTGDQVTVETVLSASLRRSSGDGGTPGATSLKVERSDVHPAVAGTAGDER